MAFIIEPVTTTTADTILAWCGVTSPTPDETAAAAFAAEAAERAIMHYRKTDALELEYLPLAAEMGVYLYTKRGVDGVTQFSENGVSRSYEAGSFPTSMLARIRLPITVG